ncbi:YbhB/YbcL family Raf kinase inhibitor-like protein (plasmid) [Tistrella mobilis]|uniref:YbhB/YbcL family Raf kinase inhibitor-like protein n=1 Tax=Tistrella mobilis TaxID=171437 RepID=UPI0035583F50
MPRPTLHTHLTLRTLPALLTTLPLVFMVAPARAQDPPMAVQATVAVVKPAKLDLPERDQDLIRRLTVPEGYEVEVYARDLGAPRMLAVSPAGTLYATRRDTGDVVMLPAADGGGARTPRTVASRAGLHGIAFDGDRVFLATDTDVYVAEVLADGGFTRLERIIDDLPDGGQHPNRTLAVGPDGQLYISVGSSCNACAETNPEHATILRASPDGQSRRIFAGGLRNTIGFDWQPETGALYGFDHGIDWLGDDGQLEELNRIEQGGRYGWPHLVDFSRPHIRSAPPDGMSLADWKAMSTEPALGYTAHAAPMQMAFHDGTGMPEDVAGDAFVAMRGSWNRATPSGYEVVRVRFEDGQPVEARPFLTGFLTGAPTRGRGDDPMPGMLGRPVGLAIMPDGAIMVGDDTNGVIYRITHPETKTAGARLTPAEPPAQKPAGRPLALERLAPDHAAEMEVTAGFEDGGSLPVSMLARGHDASPALTWSGAPQGTRSFAVVMEDADAAGPTPFVHWMIYDLPVGHQALRTGLPAAPVLRDPEGARQATNSHGGIGYTGPKPPPGDKPHACHLVVLALDIPRLEVGPAADPAAVLKAMDGHVIGAGRLVGHAGG